MKTGRRFALAVLLILVNNTVHYFAFGQPVVVLASSHFDTTNAIPDGWRGTNTGNGAELITPNPGGATSNSINYISVSENGSDGYTMYFVAPVKYLGDKHAAYNGQLNFKLKQSATGNFSGHGDAVLLKSSNLVLSFGLRNPPPTASWQSYQVPLNENAGWINITSHRFATKDDFVSVLKSLEALWIRGEYSFDDSDQSDLDDVDLLAQPSGPLAPLLTALMYAGITIDGEVGACYRIQYRDILDANTNWQKLADVVLPFTPYLFVDQSSPFVSQRFYQAVLVSNLSANLISPSNDAANVVTTPTLEIRASEPGNGNLTVTFYGRMVPTNAGPDFTIVALPDTQYYVASLNGGVPGMFYAQTDWIRTNRTMHNIVFVAHLGDCVEHGDSFLSEWRNATNALYRLETPVDVTYPFGVPYAVAVGNHDQSPNGAAVGTTTFYNQYFGVAHFSGRDYYGGHYATNNDNHFALFSAGGMDFIALFLEYDTSVNPAVVAWANSVLQTNATRRAIVVSHFIGGPTTPAAFSQQGAAIYEGLKGNTNLFLMLSGHVDGEGSREDTIEGRTVHTLVSDYQFRDCGGGGWMRIMEFSPSNNVIRVSTYNPWSDDFETDFDSKFTLTYPMTTPFTAIGTNNNVLSGNDTSFDWLGLAPSTRYEWYVTVSDGLETKTGPIWRFTTAATNSPPPSVRLSGLFR